MKTFLMLFAAVLSLLFIGCGSSNSSDPIPPIPTIKKLDIEPKDSILTIGTTEHYQVIATYSDFTTKDVTDEVNWSLEHSSGIIEPYSDRESPDLAFAKAVKTGKDKLLAALGDLNTSANVEVVDNVTLTQMDVRPLEANLSIGMEEVFVAIGEYSDGHSQDVTEEATWTSLKPGIAGVTQDGVATGIVRGNTDIVASLEDINASVAITVYDPDQMVSITLTPENPVVFLNNNQLYLTATAHYQDGSTENISTKSSTIWQTSDSGIAKFSFYKKNLVEGISEGNVTITVSYGLIKATAALQVKNVEIQTIILNPKGHRVEVGKNVNYYTEGLGNDGKYYSLNASGSIYYSTEDESIATVSNATMGRLTGRKEGNTIVKVHYEQNRKVFEEETPVTIVPSTK